MFAHHDDREPNNRDAAPDASRRRRRCAAVAFAGSIGAGGFAIWLTVSHRLPEWTQRPPGPWWILVVALLGVMVTGRRCLDLRYDATLAAILAEFDEATAAGRPPSQAVVERLRRLVARDNNHAFVAEYSLLREDARRHSLLRQILGLPPTPSRISDSAAWSMVRGISRSERARNAFAEGDYRPAAELLRRGGRWHVAILR